MVHYRYDNFCGYTWQVLSFDSNLASQLSMGVSSGKSDHGHGSCKSPAHIRNQIFIRAAHWSTFLTNPPIGGDDAQEAEVETIIQLHPAWGKGEEF